MKVLIRPVLRTTRVKTSLMMTWTERMPTWKAYCHRRLPVAGITVVVVIIVKATRDFRPNESRGVQKHHHPPQRYHVQSAVWVWSGTAIASFFGPAFLSRRGGVLWDRTGLDRPVVPRSLFPHRCTLFDTQWPRLVPFRRALVSCSPY